MAKNDRKPSIGLVAAPRRGRRPLASAPSIAGMVIAAVALAGCWMESETSLLESAKRFTAQHDHRSALLQLRTAIQKYPESQAVRMTLATVLMESGDAAGAALELEKALSLGVDPQEVVPKLARALLGSGEGRKVLQRYGQTQLDRPAAQAELLVALAAAQLQDGRESAGMDLLERALQLDPQSPWALLLQARRLAGAQRADEALALVERAQGHHPDPAQLHHLEGELRLLAHQDRDGARRAYEAALAARAGYAPAHAALVGMALAEDDLATAHRRLQSMMTAAGKHPQTLLARGQVALREGELDKAEEMVQQLRKVASEDLRVLMFAGETAARRGALAQAETFLGRVVQRAPDALGARKLLAQTRLRSGDHLRAMEVLELPIRQGQADAATHALAGQAHLQRGDMTQADRHFRAAVEMAPQDVRIRTANALLQFSRGQVHALAEMETLAAADAGITADLALLSSRAQQGDLEGALRAVRAIERKQPNNPLAANLEGRVLMRADRTAEARAAFERALRIDRRHFVSVAALAMLDVAQGKTEVAIRRLEAAAKDDPRNMQPLLALADLRARRGDPAKDVDALLLRAVKAFPDQSLPRVALIGHRLGNQDATGAVIAAQEAASALPDRPEILAVLGRAQMAAGDKQQAAITLRRLVGLEPQNVQFQMALVEAYEALGDQLAVRQTLKRALEIQPDLMTAQRNLIAMALREGKVDESLSIAREIQKQRPGDPSGLLVQGDIELHRKSWDAALQAYRSAQKLAPSTEGIIRLYGALSLAHRYPEAQAAAAAWEREHPRDVDFRIFRGDEAMGREDWAAAERHYASVRTLLPDNPLVLNNLAYCMAMLQRPGAAALAERAVSLLPDSTPLIDTLALALASEGQIERALELQRKAVERDGAVNPSLRLTLARLYLKAGDRSRARQELLALAGLGDRFAAQDQVAALLRKI